MPSWLLPALSGACVATVILILIAKRLLIACWRVFSGWIYRAL